MKHRFVLFALVLLLSLFVGCAPERPDSGASEGDMRASSLSCLSEAMAINESRAEALLDLLIAQGMTGEVLFAYPATDDADRAYYHIWMGEATVDVYMKDDGSVAAISKAGVVLYGEVPAISESVDDEGDTNGDEADTDMLPTTITIDAHTAAVAPGGMGRVSAFGMPGEQYKIKVYYASGVSSAKALAPLVAAEDGSLVWEWKVSNQVKPGVYKIEVVHAENKEDKLVLPFEVVEIEE